MAVSCFSYFLWLKWLTAPVLFCFTLMSCCDLISVPFVASQYWKGTIPDTFVYCCAWLSGAYACFPCMLPLLDTLCDGLLCSWGMRQTQKGIITFLPKHSDSMNYLRYTRWAPRQLRAWTTQDSVREPRGQGPAEEPRGITGDPEVTSKGKLNDKKSERRCGSRGMECTFIHRYVKHVYVHTSIYLGCYTQTHTHMHK